MSLGLLMCRDERWGETETYLPGSTVLAITVLNVWTRNTGDDTTNDNHARNNLELFYHILV
jgi:hypothetical protein